MTGYNGWANYETWNVSLWIQNDEGLYNLARQFSSYTDFQTFMTSAYGRHVQTRDGISYNDPALDVEELNDMFTDL